MRRLLATVLVAYVAAGMMAGLACTKVPISNINASFSLADAVWFEEEQTLFIFYRADAQQGIEPVSLIEVQYRTDTEALEWTPLTSIPAVHTHLAIDCGPYARCGSWSLKLKEVPRSVGLRLRYHPAGSLSLDAAVNLFVVASGPAYTNRSLIVYGVFDAQNLHVQWRARHQFPNLRNQEVEAYGLRRHLDIRGARTGAVPAQGPGNPYGYAAPDCPGQPLGWAPLATSDRAIFDPDTLPLSASMDSTVCATSTVTDALGTFSAVAVARKNPQVRAAFPALHSPVRAVTPVRFVLQFCNRTISAEHLAMQEQRLLLADAPTICLDGWTQPGFAASLAATLGDALDVARAQGNDLVLSFALNHDDLTGQLAILIEKALATVLLPERDKSTPRAVGAFVFDSYGRTLATAALKPLVLWCPALTGNDLDTIPAASERACPLLPDIPNITLGPFSFNRLPILPTRDQYLTFLSKYSSADSGEMQSLQFLAPERTPLSINVPLGDYGLATFFNHEILTPAPSDAFSYCAPTDQGAQSVVFRTARDATPQLLQYLPALQETDPQAAYSLGLAWDSPFLLRLTYDVVIAGQISAFTLSVPFGIHSGSEANYGSELWSQSQFDLTQVLKQCTAFCGAPTFDSGGVYNVNDPFRTVYENQCYTPLFPALGDNGFPLDP
jgi:hypothetical protein